ncbi:hypothetical protein [Pseudoduganella umbonata]|uniref:Putative membrane protein n=1 Tax=Pseudoduganella umbonata TaxID=864828 RepID=A0A4P8HWW7_9BURK|nr:hypothetical protein [Pseudoduganella umbonata]MBB3222852.1 putative membrane protein [Pseudoduganella umbonata]QCP12984.1 hypothetical protein FCL38_22965 [Pseudoduganella umbonata]
MTIKPSSASFDNFGQQNAAQHRELGHYVANDATFPTAYLRAVAAIASSDGILNVADFNALNDVAALMNDSALARVVLLECVEHPLNWKTAFDDLHAASAGIDQATAAEAFEAARALLSIQGTRSREMAASFAEALRYQVRPGELEAFPANEQSLWSKVSLGSVRMLKGRKYADLADLCVRATGDVALAGAVLECEQGTLDKAELSRRMTAACARVSQEISAFNDRIADFESSSDTAAAFLASAHGLQKQVGQRLAVADARIALERETFDEDLEESIHDAGNAFEREVVDRLNTDQWKRAATWESIAKSTFGKELERRVNRVISRRERSLQLLHEDLRLFQEEMALSRSTILKRLHHTELAGAAPALRWGTRLRNGAEDATNMTLKVGGAAAIGTGAAAYFLGAAAVMPVIAPVAPIVGGALLVAGVFKWMMNPAERKLDEVGHQREMFEKAFREQLEAARRELGAQLDATSQQFHQAAERMVQPVILEAQAADRLATLHLKMARRLNDHSQKALAEMLAALPD